MNRYKVRTRPLPWPTENPRAREEWDFRARGKAGWYEDKIFGPFAFLDDDEVHHCATYEFDRNSPHFPGLLEQRQKLPEWQAWQESVGRWPTLSIQEREALAAKTFDALLKSHLRESPAKKVYLEAFFLPWPEWPNRPYLSVSRPERQRRFRESWKGNPGRMHRLVKLRDIFDDMRDYSEGKSPSRVFGWNRMTFNDDVWTYPRHLRPREGQSPIVIAALENDFNLPNKQMVRLYINWLNYMRQLFGYKPQQTRGVSSAVDRDRKRLCVLGARRLVQAGFTYTNLVNFTGKLTGKPLFASKSSLSHALKRRDY